MSVPTRDEIKDKDRRNFMKLLGVMIIGAGVAGTLRSVVQNIIPPIEGGASSFPILTLYLPNGNPVSTDDLIVNNPQTVTFNFPLENEPNFLLRLGDSNNKDVEINPTEVRIPANNTKYKVPGGVGPYKSVVAASAICQHLGCIPPEIHFNPPSSSSFPGKIHCDCHGSTYDPYSGFGVVTGPTQAPLPSVVLSYDEKSDSYSATLLVGPTIYGHSSDLTGGSNITPSGKTTVTTTQ
jgi:Rieske Fe-S protein